LPPDCYGARLVAAKGGSKPIGHWNPEAHLRPIDERRREAALRRFLEQVPADAVVDLVSRGRRDPVLNDLVIEQRRARFQGAVDGRDVHLDQEVARQVGAIVAAEHPVSLRRVQ
jgi:hypothetical protein